MNFKDYFSTQSKDYSLYRPHYPEKLFDFICSQVPTKNSVWDCATGNGQAAVVLSKYFQKVYATDASSAQIQNATPLPNIEYRVASAERSTLSDQSIDLVTVAQAFHWFHFDQFFEELKRVSTSQGILAIWSYGLHLISENIDPIVHQLYEDILGIFWPKERKYVEEKYQSIPFPFQEIETPSFEMETHWNLHQLIGYLSTWSSTQKYIQQKNQNPIELVFEKLLAAWGDPNEEKKVHWPIYLRMGGIK